MTLATGVQAEDVKRAHKKLALRHHPDKAAAAGRLCHHLGAGVGVASEAAAAARLQGEIDRVFKLVQEAREELSDDRACAKCRRALTDEAHVFRTGAALASEACCNFAFRLAPTAAGDVNLVSPRSHGDERCMLMRLRCAGDAFAAHTWTSGTARAGAQRNKAPNNNRYRESDYSWGSGAYGCRW